MDHYNIWITSNLLEAFHQCHILQAQLHFPLDLSIQIYQELSTIKEVCYVSVVSIFDKYFIYGFQWDRIL